MKTTYEILQMLTDAHGAPGFEMDIRDLLIKEWQPYCGEMEVDGMGNLIAQPKEKKANRPTVALMAHMDEVGLIVRDITEDGYIKVHQLGGWHESVLAGQRWVIKTDQGNVIGYSGVESGHLNPDYPNLKPIKLHGLTIDIGAKSREQAMNKYHIRPGLPITPDSKCEYFNGKKKIIAKALDDRLGLALMTKVMMAVDFAKLPVNLVFVATVQEELGTRGAEVIYNQVKPDLVLNFESAMAADFPLHGDNSLKIATALNNGPTMTMHDSSFMPHPDLVKWVRFVAQQNAIPLQLEVYTMGSQDASCLQRSGNGVLAVNIAIPVRYVHSHSGIMTLKDLERGISLVDHLLQNTGQLTFPPYKITNGKTPRLFNLPDVKQAPNAGQTHVKDEKKEKATQRPSLKTS